MALSTGSANQCRRVRYQGSEWFVGATSGQVGPGQKTFNNGEPARSYADTHVFLYKDIGDLKNGVIA